MYERCEKLRPTLFRLASDTTDDDEALGTVSFSRVGSTHPRVWAPRGALCLPWGCLCCRHTHLRAAPSAPVVALADGID